MKYNLGLSSITPSSPSVPTPGLSYFPARVKKIILNENDPDWNDNGGWDALGLINFVPYYPGGMSTFSNNGARPFYPNIKHYPLIDEVVMILQLPNPSIQDPYYSSFYYVDVVNLWNHPHHNAFPDNGFQDSNNNNQLDYRDISAGLSYKEEDKSKDAKLGNTFKEKSNIKPLLPFEGDTIYEGRWGQSIRFGSTVRNNSNNNWSTKGNDGDPLIIIRNGQSIKLDEKGWIPTTEDINNDESSIYFCSGQLIPINVASTNMRSFNSNIAKIDISTQTLSDNPSSSVPIPVTQSVTTSSISNPTQTQTTSSIIYTEDEVEYTFPGEPDSTFMFEYDPNPGDHNITIETKPETYNSSVIMSESSQTKAPNGDYYLYSNGQIIGRSPIIFIDKIRVAKVYEDKVRLLLDNARAEGIPIRLNSSLRTWDEQLNLRKQNVKDKSKINDLEFLTNAPSSEFVPMTGKPGYSNHQNGKAVDLNTANPSVYKWLAKNAIKYGFVRTVKSERWHWEYRENTNQFAFVPKEDPTWDGLV